MIKKILMQTIFGELKIEKYLYILENVEKEDLD